MTREGRKFVNALKRARGYIAIGWTKGDYALDAAKESVSPTSPAAVCWCVTGAIQRVYPIVPGGSGVWRRRAYDHVVKAIRGRQESDCGDSFGDLMDYNDAPHRTKRQVLALFDRAIKALEKEAA